MHDPAPRGKPGEPRCPGYAGRPNVGTDFGNSHCRDRALHQMFWPLLLAVDTSHVRMPVKSFGPRTTFRWLSSTSHANES